MKNILQGNVLDRIKDIEEKSVQCVVTSPPYWGLRDYGTAEWEQGDEECDHIEKIPFSGNTGIRDHRKETTKKEVEGKSIQYKSKCKKCGAIRKDSQLGLEETPEEFIENMVKVFRGVKKALKDDGTLWLNLGDSYSMSSMRGVNSEFKSIDQSKQGIVGINKKIPNGLKAKDLIGIPWRVALALQQDGWYLRQDIIWHKPNPMPESVKDRCTKAHEYIFLLSKSPQYYYDSDAIKDKPHYGEEVGANKRSVWSINVKGYKEAHFATFPEKLPELCIKAGSKKGDIVLDPFFGSGTTGWVAQRLGREWLGIELNPEFIKIAEKRFIQRELF